jgi:hypothetical protein
VYPVTFFTKVVAVTEPMDRPVAAVQAIAKDKRVNRVLTVVIFMVILLL